MARSLQLVIKSQQPTTLSKDKAWPVRFPNGSAHTKRGLRNGKKYTPLDMLRTGACCRVRHVLVYRGRARRLAAEACEMKNCTHCKFAQWEKTNAGKRHPSGGGHCTYEYKLPTLPASMFWYGGEFAPARGGGDINRRKELKTDCAYFAWTDK